MKVFVPGDAAAVSVGADDVAAAFEAAGAVVVRNGSRGMLSSSSCIARIDTVLNTKGAVVGTVDVDVPQSIAAEAKSRRSLKEGATAPPMVKFITRPPGCSGSIRAASCRPRRGG